MAPVQTVSTQGVLLLSVHSSPALRVCSNLVQTHWVSFSSLEQHVTICSTVKERIAACPSMLRQRARQRLHLQSVLWPVTKQNSLHNMWSFQAMLERFCKHRKNNFRSQRLRDDTEVSFQVTMAMVTDKNELSKTPL